MLWFALALSAAITTTLYVVMGNRDRNDYYREDPVEAFWCVLAVGSILALFVNLGIAAAVDNETKPYVKYACDIKPISGDKSIVVTVDDGYAAYHYACNGTFETLTEYGVTIREQEGATPRVEHFYVDNDPNLFLTVFQSDNIEREVVFTVPPGAVEQNFAVDAD